MSSMLTDTSQAVTTKAGILIVDDDVTVRETLIDLLEASGYSVVGARNADEALDAMRRSSIDLVLTDLCLPGTSGVELLRQLRRVDNQLLAIVLSSYRMIAHAVEAMKAGAFDFIAKPVDLEAVEMSIQRALEFRQLKKENQRLHSRGKEKYCFGNIVGGSTAMCAVNELIKKVAATDSAIMVVGESGTGKELVAQTIHYNSHRHNNPFIPVNCGSIPEHLLESELFGNEQGVLTGSSAACIGRFERANGGTIFLNEVAEISLPLQVKLLRVLQERSFVRVGGTQTIHVDIRVIAATNRNLEQAVANKQFRDDLYSRLHVISVTIPPLRERVSDIPMLIEHCLEKFRQGKRSKIDGISPEAIRILEQYSWLGNVRELENVLERIVTLKHHGMIEPEDLPDNIWHGNGFVPQPDPNNTQDFQAVMMPDTPGLETRSTWRNESDINLSKSVDEFETRLIVEALRRSKWVKSRAAQLLSMNRTTLVEKLKKKGISKSDF